MPSSFRRSVHLIGSFFLALLIACGTASSVIAGAEVAVVVSAVEALIVGRGSAKPNDPLYSGDEVLVLRKGSLTFRFKDGRVVRLEGGSRARISHITNQDGVILGDITVLLGQGWLVNAETGTETALEENLIQDAGGDPAASFGAGPDRTGPDRIGPDRIGPEYNAESFYEAFERFISSSGNADRGTGGSNRNSTRDQSGSGSMGGTSVEAVLVGTSGLAIEALKQSVPHDFRASGHEPTPESIGEGSTADLRNAISSDGVTTAPDFRDRLSRDLRRTIADDLRRTDRRKNRRQSR